MLPMNRRCAWHGGPVPVCPDVKYECMFLILRPFSGQYNDHKDEGSYRCVVCGNRIFVSDHKYKTHCGWPAFNNIVSHDKVKLADDTSNGKSSSEILW